MEHAWLDSLSEDWVSQPGSEASPPQLHATKDIENVRLSSAQGSGGRIPRPPPRGKPSHSTTADNSVNILSERSLNNVNLPTPPRRPSKISQEVKFAEGGRQLRRTVSASTNGSVIHNTVQHNLTNTSPRKSKGQTPEWKRRLVYGDLAYGEQKDLFCSAANGLENIFKPPVAPSERSGEGNSALNETTLPSSPPPYDGGRDTTVDHEEPEEIEEQQRARENHRNPLLRMRYRMTEDNSGTESQNSDFSIRPDTNEVSQEDSSVHETVEMASTSTNGLAPARDELRKASGQSVVRNEDFSPILLSRHSSGDGKVDFAPIEVPVDQLLHKLEKLRINQMLLDSQVAGNIALESRLEETSHQLETTEDYERNGGFLNLRRGGRSAEGSFRHRMLSPGLGTDTSEILPEESVQASTPKQFPTIRLEGLDSPSRTISQSPSIPRVPHPSPEKRMLQPEGSVSSPLKLFGPYDTFTNQTLMRRISQFEEQTSGSSKMSAGGGAEDLSQSECNEAFMAASSPQKPRDEQQPANVPRSRSVSKFGAGDLEGYQFKEDLSYLSHDGSASTDDSRERAEEHSAAGEPNHKFSLMNSSSPSGAEDLVIKRKRQKSSTPDVSARHGRSHSTASQNMAGDYSITMLSRSDVPVTPKKRDTGSDGKRPRTSPSKDPTPKRRRTLHKSDIAYGQDEHLVLMESIQHSSAHMQSAMGKKRKDARPGDLQQPANPNVLAARQILRPRTPTPSQRSSLEREQHPFADKMPTTKSPRRSPKRGPAAASSVLQSEVGSETDRKPSIKTQDFLDEAGKIMAMIRNQVKPPSGLTSVEESEAENGGYSPALEESFQDSTKEPLSRPPSRDGGPVSRMPPRQEDPEILDHLKKYQERSDMGDIVSSSLRSMGLAKNAIRSAQEIEQQLYESFKAHEHLRDVSASEIFSDPPNIRISGPVGGNRESTSRAAGSDFPSNSSGGSTNRSIPTGSSRASDSKNFIPPQNVSHIIPDQLGSMYLDREKNIWIKTKKHIPRSPSRNVLPSEASEDDPFADIPDLSVDMTREMQNLRLLSTGKAVTQNSDGMMTPDSPLKTPRSQAARNYATLSPDAALGQELASSARDELRKLENKGGFALSEQHEDVEHEIMLDEDRVTRSTPSRRRNLTISFSSPISSIIQDVVPEDLDDMDDDPSLKLDVARADDQEPSSKNVYPSLTKSARKQLLQRPRSVSRGPPRQLSVSGEVFVPRPVSRIDEQDEESGLAQDRQVSLIGDRSIVGRTTEPRRASLNIVVSTPARIASAQPDASAIISQNVGNLSLSPLSEFTLNQPDQSFGFEVSYIVGERHLVTGNGAKKVMSMTIRDLVDRLTEAEPFEPFWEDLMQLDLHDQRLSSLHMLDEFCGRLVTLDASRNGLAHLDGIPPTIRELKVTHNRITELTSWDHLMNLQYVDISNNEVKSLHALKNLVHLRSLRADNNQLTSLDGINFHDGLLTLRARDNLIQEVDFEGTKLHRLTELDLGGNEITTVRGVGQLASLQTLKLQRNRLESFTVDRAEGLPHLRHLDLSDNYLVSLDVGRIPVLRLLHADRNRISTMTGFTKARYLDSLSLREQQGGVQLDLSFLAAAYEVRKLFLSGNYLGVFNPGVDFLNLQLLELANCGLQSLPERLGQLMPNLRTLNLNFNAIMDLSPLQFIPRLKKLFVAGNRLTDSASVTELLIEYPHLTQLDLRDNPITLGFYPPLQVLVPADRTGLVDDFVLPEADVERDEQFSGRLDDTTKLRRKLYQVVFVQCCKRLKRLDGLPVHRQRLLAKDCLLETLVEDGLLPGEVVNGAASPAKSTTKSDRSQWYAEDSFG